MKWLPLAALVALSTLLPIQASAMDVRETVRAAIKADDGFPPSLYTDQFENTRKQAVTKDGLAAEGGLTGEAGTGKIEVRSLRVVGNRVLADIFSRRDGAAPLRKNIVFFIAENGKIADVDTNTRGKYRSAAGPIQQMPTLLRRYRDVLQEKSELLTPVPLSNQNADGTNDKGRADRAVKQPSYPRAKAGELYPAYRKRVQQLGWNLSSLSVDPAVCASTDKRCSAFPEVVSCSGTTSANCQFKWWSGSTELVINTTGINDIVDNVYEQKIVPIAAASQLEGEGSSSSNNQAKPDQKLFGRVATMLDRMRPVTPENKVKALLDHLKPETLPSTPPIPEALPAGGASSPQQGPEAASRARITAMLSHEAPQRTAPTFQSFSAFDRSKPNVSPSASLSGTSVDKLKGQTRDDNILDDLIISELKRCWSFENKMNTKNYIPEFAVELNLDGTFYSTPRLLNRPSDSEDGLARLAASGLSALMKCEPLTLPKTLMAGYRAPLKRTIRFDPKKQ